MSFGGDWGISAAVANAGRRFEGQDEREHMEEIANRASERDWSRNVIQKTVSDAQAAGIHPLFAMGVSPSSSSPISIGGGGGGGADMSGLADSISNKFNPDAESRAEETHRAQIEVLKSEAARNNAVAQATAASVLARGVQAANYTNPGTVIPGQGVVGGIKTEPVSVTPVPKGSKIRSAWGFEVNPDSNFAMNHSQLMQDRYGEPGEWIEGLPLYVRDVARTVRQNYVDMINRQSDQYKDAARTYGGYPVSE